MKEPKLTKEESVHIKNGGRVFLVEEISGSLWRILLISKKGTSLLCNPTVPRKQEGYSDFEDAKNLAYGIANLSEDNPIVRIICMP
ncbi:MAG: hypothetical protein ACRD50_17470 [Candidatus Acidiferrales bacterium]